MLQDNAKKIPLWVDALLLLVISAFFLSHSWQKWADPIIDFGREVYVPWRITLGEVLYKDMAFLYGAFPPYWNALLFKIFGPSILTLAVFNIFIVGLQTFLIYRLCFKLFDRLTALTAAIVFLCLFAFNQHMTQNMYYITPYSHSNVYALFLGFCALNILHSYLLNPRPKRIFYLGLCLGLMVLCRMEFFFTLIIPVLINLMIFLWKNKTSPDDILRLGVALLSGLYLPIIGFLIYFSHYFSLPDAFLHIIGYTPNWKAVSDIYIYKLVAGYIDWQKNIKILGIVLLSYGALFAAFHMLCAGLQMNFRNHKNLIKLFLVICSAVTLVYFVHFVGITYIHEIFRGQAIFVILLGAFSIRKFISVTGQTSWARWLVVLTFCGWALLMLYKVPLRAINFNYGRLHCLPGVIASIACLTLVMPLHFEKYYRSGWIVKTIICTLLLIVCAVTFSLSIGWAGLRMIPLGHGANKLWAYSSSYPSGPGYDVDLFLKWAEVNIKPEETFVAFPQGAMLNFLTRHRMTGRHITFMPAEMIAYGEESMLDTLTAEPPDYFLFINNDIRINGNFIVGHEYGSMIYNWVNTNYIPVWQTGKEFGNYGFGITVLKRRPY